MWLKYKESRDLKVINYSFEGKGKKWYYMDKSMIRWLTFNILKRSHFVLVEIFVVIIVIQL
jgi:hypothetical protein